MLYLNVHKHIARCAGPNIREIRLVGGSTGREGRVEVCERGRWWTLCTESQSLARTVCSLIGIPIVLEGDYYSHLLTVLTTDNTTTCSKHCGSN